MTVELAHLDYPAETGGRPAVVLLHGLGSSAADWQLQLPALVARWPVLAVDLRGHGHSPPVRGWYRMDAIAADVARLLERKTTSPCHIVGLSLGAAAGLQLTLDRPDLVRSLVLVNGFAGLKVGWRGGAGGLVRLALLLAGRMDWLGRWVARTVFPHRGQRELRRLAARRIGAMRRQDYLHSLWAIARFDAADRLARVEAPTLVVAGLQDQIVPRSAKLRLFRQLPNAAWAPVPGSGHATPIDAPDIFNQLLVAFLQANDPPAAGRNTPAESERPLGVPSGQVS